MRRVTRGFLIFVSVTDGLAGVVSGVLLIAGPDGHLLQAGALLPVIRTLPLASVFFRNFIWIGVAMLLVLGLPNVVAAAMLLRQNMNQYTASLVAAVLLVLWCSFELIFMFNVPAVAYLAVGVISVVCSILLLRPARADNADQSQHPAARWPYVVGLISIVVGMAGLVFAPISGIVYASFPGVAFAAYHAFVSRSPARAAVAVSAVAPVLGLALGAVALVSFSGGAFFVQEWTAMGALYGMPVVSIVVGLPALAIACLSPGSSSPRLPVGHPG